MERLRKPNAGSNPMAHSASVNVPLPQRYDVEQFRPGRSPMMSPLLQPETIGMSLKSQYSRTVLSGTVACTRFTSSALTF